MINKQTVNNILDQMKKLDDKSDEWYDLQDQLYQEIGYSDVFEIAKHLSEIVIESIKSRIDSLRVSPRDDFVKTIREALISSLCEGRNINSTFEPVELEQAIEDIKNDRDLIDDYEKIAKDILF